MAYTLEKERELPVGHDVHSNEMPFEVYSSVSHHGWELFFIPSLSFPADRLFLFIYFYINNVKVVPCGLHSSPVPHFILQAALWGRLGLMGVCIGGTNIGRFQQPKKCKT